MSLPTSRSTVPTTMPAMFSQSNPMQGMSPAHLPLMGLRGMHPSYPYMVGSQQGLVGLPQQGLRGLPQQGLVRLPQQEDIGTAPLMSTSATNHFNSAMLNERTALQQTSGNGHLSPSQQIPDSSSNHQIAPYRYDNITVKQEMGVPAGNSSDLSVVQYPQLSSTDGNPFSVPGSASPMSKHICAVCGDRASGKHYGVYSCEGCKGFFKRTVRKFLTYTCRDEKECVIDKRQRNRCQYCRYQKCTAMGMKKEAVQEERQKNKETDEGVGDLSAVYDDMPVNKILEAEIASDVKPDLQPELLDTEASICRSADHQLFTLVGWAKRVPHFPSLPLDDQVTLLRAGWNELLIASFSHRSIEIPDGIILASGLRVFRQSAHSAGVGAIFDRVLTELIAKMRDMSMDRAELGCLRAIVLFNPDAKDLSDSLHIEGLREKVYASLEVYCKTKYPEQPGRFAKLLLRLPALRSIGLKCLEHLFFFKLIGNTPIDQFLMEKLSGGGEGDARPERPASSAGNSHFGSSSSAT